MEKEEPTKTFDFLAGEMLMIDKPYGWTSFDVVNKLRYTIKYYHKVKKVKVGHAGTLDPRATGLLIICTGRKTKEIDSYQARDKEYTGTIELGKETPSYDKETEATQVYDISGISNKEILEAAKKFEGTQEQLPPQYSAKKIKGQRAYNLVRNNEKADIKPITVNIKQFEIARIEIPYIDFKVICEKGVYVRTLAHDFGKVLNNGAVLSALRRTRIGEYKIEQAHNLFELVEKLSREQEFPG
ncbi:MAG: tRNA pseudouridine(55) synthase TruB [Bacteroidales bacterium]|nr:tRNA pseudouridine(55) synthase TruB [Bacteroidales bacterium]MCF8336973.1 tRNA pseudouridine(55) synthase TruB [Bacteroidales bacterium]